MKKILNRFLLVGSLIALPFDIIGISQGNEASLPWALLMIIIFFDSLRTELEMKGK